MVFLPFIIFLLLALFLAIVGIVVWFRFAKITDQKQAGKGNVFFGLWLLAVLLLVFGVHFLISSYQVSNAWRNLDYNIWIGFLSIVFPVIPFTLIGIALYYDYRRKHETEEEREKRKKDARSSRGIPW